MGKMKVLMFMRRFVPAIMGGIKTSTIRTSGRLQVGDVVSMRYWAGLPYRSKTVEFFRARITAKTWVGMDYSVYGLFIWLGRRRYVPIDEHDRIARHEGFGCWWNMAEWFISNHDMPFSGWMLSWEPKLLPLRTMTTKTSKCYLGNGEFDHEWRKVSDWYGDPGVCGGTADFSFLRCRVCGEEKDLPFDWHESREDI